MDFAHDPTDAEKGHVIFACYSYDKEVDHSHSVSGSTKGFNNSIGAVNEVYRILLDAAWELCTKIEMNKRYGPMRK